MLQINIKKQGIITNSAEFETRQDADNWLAQEETNQSFGTEYSVEILDITAQVEQEQINREALQYLADTDWYVIRSIDGIAVPLEISEARAAARLRIVR